MKTLLKKLLVTSLIAMSVIGVMPVAASAEWKQDSENNYFWVEDGAKAQGWKYIGGEWYNFRNDGVMQIGWVQDNGAWYYLWSNGSMAHDAWVSNSGTWYYFGLDGKMINDRAVVGQRVYNFYQPTYVISDDLNGQTIKTTTGAAVTTTSSAVKVK